jgi:hypothetical protein
MTKYSPETFREIINSWFEDDDDPPADGLLQAIEDDVLSWADDGEEKAREAAEDFEYGGNTVFNDFWETNLHEYTVRFIWCCYAISWGIRIYDAAVPDKVVKS